MPGKYKTPRGTRDFLPEEMISRNYIFSQIKNVFERFGFNPLETPAFEEWALLKKKGSGGNEIKDEIYYFKDKSERELGLRFDLTVPTARVVANNPQLPKPFKRYQIGRVWRYDRPQAGRFREFWQADVDIIGSEKMDCEAECIAIAVETLKQLGFKDFSIRLNNRKVLNGLIELTKIENPAQAFRILDKLEKIGEKEVLKQLEHLTGEKKAKKLLQMISIKGRPDNVISKGRDLLKGIKTAEEGLSELEEIVQKSKTYGTADKISIDFSLVRGLDYYTGPIYEISIKSKTSVGSVAGGGRYDNLIGLYGGKQTPASGFSFGVERIYEIMKNDGMLKVQKTYTRVFVVSVNNDARENVLKLAQKLRKQGIPTETDMLGRNLRKQMEYINSSGIPYALIVGEREIKAGRFTLRDMKTGKEKWIGLNELVKALKL